MLDLLIDHHIQAPRGLIRLLNSRKVGFRQLDIHGFIIVPEDISLMLLSSHIYNFHTMFLQADYIEEAKKVLSFMQKSANGLLNYRKPFSILCVVVRVKLKDSHLLIL